MHGACSFKKDSGKNQNSNPNVIVVDKSIETPQALCEKASSSPTDTSLNRIVEASLNSSTDELCLTWII